MSCSRQARSELNAAIEITHTPSPIASVIATIDATVAYPDRQIDLIYQPFEQGFIVWDIEKNCGYAYQDAVEQGIIIPKSLEKDYSPGNMYTYCLPEPVTERPDLDMNAPTGLRIPDGQIGLIWKAYPELADNLGYASDDQQQYIGSIPYEGTAITLVCCNVAALPDGRILQCGMYGHSAGTCNLSKKQDD